MMKIFTSRQYGCYPLWIAVLIGFAVLYLGNFPNVFSELDTLTKLISTFKSFVLTHLLFFLSIFLLVQFFIIFSSVLHHHDLREGYTKKYVKGWSSTIRGRGWWLFIKCIFFRNLLELVMDPKHMFYTWCGVSLAYLQLFRQF